jgi:hypothetical protein
MEARDDEPKVASQKKAYVAPKLARLGSVRDLTFGTSLGTKPDGTLTRKTDK